MLLWVLVLPGVHPLLPLLVVMQVLPSLALVLLLS
jgi:hypothetical protein